LSLDILCSFAFFPLFPGKFRELDAGAELQGRPFHGHTLDAFMEGTAASWFMGLPVFPQILGLQDPPVWCDWQTLRSCCAEDPSAVMDMMLDSQVPFSRMDSSSSQAIAPYLVMWIELSACISVHIFYITTV
jgi:hypothetical protein